MKWTRKTNEFEYQPYVSEDGRFVIGDIDDQNMIPEYTELKKHNWDNEKAHNEYMKYCKENKIRINGANWVLKDNEKVIGIYKTAKQAKAVAEEI